MNIVTGEAWPVLHHHKNVSKDELWRVLSVGAGMVTTWSLVQQSTNYRVTVQWRQHIYIYDHVTEYFAVIGLF